MAKNYLILKATTSLFTAKSELKIATQACVAPDETKSYPIHADMEYDICCKTTFGIRHR